MEDGIKCASGKMCYEQRCVSVSSLGFPQCPTGSNGQVCSGNGVKYSLKNQYIQENFTYHSQNLQVCINEGNCLCSIYFTGATCEEPLRMYHAIVMYIHMK